MEHWPGKPWDDADLEALYELAPTCTYPQIALYLGRSVKSIEHKIAKLRRAGAWDHSVARSGSGSCGARRSPFVIPGNAILVAKTCPKCGKLRGASCWRFRRRPSGIEWRTECNICANAGKQRSPEAVARQQARARALDDAVQQVTVEHADRSGEVYTSADMQVAADVERSDFEVAITLGRTLYAVRSLRHKLQVKRPRRKLDDSGWLIRFPNAMVALREHYRVLGVVPESEWEWSN